MMKNTIVSFRLNLNKKNEAYIHAQLMKYASFISKGELIKKVLFHYFKYLEKKQTDIGKSEKVLEGRKEGFSIDDLSF